MLKSQELEVLLKAGHSQVEVACLTEVGRRPSRWFVLKACRGNSINTTSHEWR
jgi:hypothetical protein